MSFCYHLRSYKYIRLTCCKFIKDFRISVFSTYGIRIHSYCSRLRKKFFNFFLNLLRSPSEIAYPFWTAYGTFSRSVNCFTTVMTYQLSVWRMVFIWNVAVFALHDISAASAWYECRVSSSVHKKHYLRFAVKGCFNGWIQRAAKHASVAFFQFFSHVWDFHNRLFASVPSSFF